MAHNMHETELDPASLAHTPASAQPQSERPKTPAHQNADLDTDEAREAALRKELAGVRNINEVMEGMIGTLEKAKSNMAIVSGTVTNASTLLNTWTRIVSQTEHNNRLIQNPNWKGASQDLIEIESEALYKQQEAERRAAEAERRREEATRRAEEQKRQRLAGSASSSRGVVRGAARGANRGRGVARGSSSGYGRGSAASSADTTTSSSASARNASGIGRGFGTRGGAGRSRGVR